MNLDFKHAKKEIVDTCMIGKLKRAEDVIVFGAGGSGDWTVDVLRKHGIIPRCYCDNSERKQGKTHNDLDVLSFEAAIRLYPEAAICIASMWQEEIQRQIIAYDPRLGEHMYNLLLSMAWETTNRIYISSEEEYIRGNLSRFEELCKELDDACSRKTLRGILNYRLTRERSYLDEIKSSGSVYTDEDIWGAAPADGDFYLIDGGAYDGDTAEDFAEAWGGRARLYIYCFEADRANCRLLEDKKALFYPHQLFVSHSALWDSTGSGMVLSDSGLSGRVTEQGTECVVTKRIDDLDFERLDFIKLDIEGAERRCLEGARKTIETYHPGLAICAYHLQDDLFVLSDFIKSLDCPYDMKLRHYKNSAGDTILYAVPRKQGK